MGRTTTALAALTCLVALLLLATPVLASQWYDVFQDVYYPEQGYGIAHIHLPDGTNAVVWYRDMDGSESFTPGDYRFRTLTVHAG